ncbi:MAG: hypothetical protein HYU39_04895 [Thaumarchaeota archaeon]|nr:hypothetical protein [Nitrososphaerota archaeon]
MSSHELVLVSPFLVALFLSLLLMGTEWKSPQRVMVASFMNLAWAALLYLFAFAALILFWLHEVLELTFSYEGLSEAFLLTTGTLMLLRNIVAVAFLLRKKMGPMQ